MPLLKKIAYILAFVFTLFVAGPTIVICIDKDVDVAFAFTANEEENSAKNLLNLEFMKDEHTTKPTASLLFNDENTGRFFYDEDHHQVFLEVLSPPPRYI
ncbi:MAG: hypothetical protein WBL21_06395 [Salinimicrobium sp.]